MLKKFRKTKLLQITDPSHPSDLPTSLGKVVGIDLGTTHSVVSVVKDGKPHVLTFEGEGPLIPSILTLENDEFKVGLDLGETLRSTKRLMGKGAQQLQIGAYRLTPVEVASKILAHLKSLVEQTDPFEAAVITVPAYFDEAARVATKQAATLAGIKVLRLINEPTAAALAYGLETGVEGIYAVYDFGGGTFDISLLKLEKGVFQVLATGGDLTLGGDDIDQALASAKGLNLNHARRVKEKLTTTQEAEGVQRTDLEEMAASFINRTFAITEDVFKEAGLSPHTIEGVVLVGGMTRMPYVRRQVEAFFKKRPLCDMNPDEAVALGAALSAHGLVYGADTLLLDVAPLSLGLETMGGLVEKLIPRNTPLPALATQEFTTHQDGQGGIVIHVVQGEREFAADCLSLARFEFYGLPSLPAGAVRIRVDFIVDVEGLLTVTAFEKTTGLSHHVEVRPSDGFDKETLIQMILESQKYGKEDIQKRVKTEENLRKKSYSLCSKNSLI